MTESDETVDGKDDHLRIVTEEDVEEPGTGEGDVVVREPTRQYLGSKAVADW